MNKAKSVYNISSRSTLYTPIIDPPSRIPNTFQVDLQSEWYKSALISSAVETVTLPSRLRSYYDFEASLTGGDSTRRIFELQSSLLPDSHAAGLHHNEEAAEEESSKTQTEFDLDFSHDGPTAELENSHIFNQVQVIRGVDHSQGGEPSADAGLMRKQRLYNSEPMLHRQVYHLNSRMLC